jgi:hypothetical protein
MLVRVTVNSYLSQIWAAVIAALLFLNAAIAWQPRRRHPFPPELKALGLRGRWGLERGIWQTTPQPDA